MEKFCKWYLSWKLRKKGINSLEIVIRSDGDTIYRRNFKKEKIIKNICKKIKNQN